MDRNLVNIIQKMICEIPKTEIKFINRLKTSQQNVLFTAPELRYLRWEEVHETLWGFIPNMPTEEWQFKVLSIFSTKTLDELKEIFK